MSTHYVINLEEGTNTSHEDLAAAESHAESVCKIGTRPLLVSTTEDPDDWVSRFVANHDPTASAFKQLRSDPGMESLVGAKIAEHG